MPEPRRIALYSHDSVGLGHLRRNLAIAASLGHHEPDTELLLIGSAAGAERLALPPRTTFARVPGVVKNAAGGYASADPRYSLAEALDRRGRAVTHLLASFRPDLVVVDKLARGLLDELDPALRWLESTTWAGARRPRLVLGLRDVLDDPRTARAEWDLAASTSTVLRHYDEVWVYGDPSVYDLVRECRLPAPVADRVRYTGYLADGRERGGTAGAGAATATEHPYVLCTVGGGSDGLELASTFVRSELPEGHRGVLVTGPHMSDADVARLRHLTAARPELGVHRFVADPLAWIGAAAAVVTMGGYNTVCEVLSSGRPALVVPRVRPRLEQSVRARSLARRTSLAVMAPDRATPGSVAQWMREAVRTGHLRHDVDLGGLDRVPRLAAELLAATHDRKEAARAYA